MIARGAAAGFAALAVAGAAQAQAIPPCPLLPPVEEIEPAKLPPPLLASLAKDVGLIALPGKPFDESGESKIGVSRRLIWVRKQGTRWVVAYEEGGATYHDVVISYEIGYDGSIAGIRKDRAFPATVCMLTERELWR